MFLIIRCPECPAWNCLLWPYASLYCQRKCDFHLL